jgi:uncharacterized protein YbjT (DUF2867 family)
VRVLVAGATGVIGRQLIPMLAAGGHQVVGMARQLRAGFVTTPDVELVTADALDPSAVSAAVRAAAPRRSCQPASVLEAGILHDFRHGPKAISVKVPAATSPHR